MAVYTRNALASGATITKAALDNMERGIAAGVLARQDVPPIAAGTYTMSDLASVTVDGRGRVAGVTRNITNQDITWTTGNAQPTQSATIPEATHVWYIPANAAQYANFAGSSADGGFRAYYTNDSRVQMYVQGGAYLTQSNAVIDQTKPHILAVSYDSVTGFLMSYLDGIPIGTDRRVGGWSFTGAGTVTTAAVTEYRRFTRVLRGGELRQVFRELSVKYGQPLTARISANTVTPLQVANVKGFNQHPKSAQFSGGRGVFEQFWGAQWDWAWVQDSIDRSASRGAKVYRIIGDVNGIKAGTITQATYTARVTQIADYIVSKGMRLYYCGCDLNQRGDAVQADIVAQYVEVAKVLQARAANVFGFDLANEIRSTYGTTPKSTSFPWMQAASAAIRQAAPDVPLSVSDIGGGGSDDGGSAGGIVSRAACFGEYQAWAPYVDFFDVHAYEDSVGEFRPWQLAPYLLAVDRPLCIGEFGSDLSVSNGDALGAALYARVGAIRAATQGVVALLQWAIRNDQYGLYKEADGAARPASVAAFDAL